MYINVSVDLLYKKIFFDRLLLVVAKYNLECKEVRAARKFCAGA